MSGTGGSRSICKKVFICGASAKTKSSQLSVLLFLLSFDDEDKASNETSFVSRFTSSAGINATYYIKKTTDGLGCEMCAADIVLSETMQTGPDYFHTQNVGNGVVNGHDVKLWQTNDTRAGMQKTYFVMPLGKQLSNSDVSGKTTKVHFLLEILIVGCS